MTRDNLRPEAVVAIEGIATAWTNERVDEWLSNDADRTILYDSLRALEAVPDLMGASAHLLAVTQVR